MHRRLLCTVLVLTILAISGGCRGKIDTYTSLGPLSLNMSAEQCASILGAPAFEQELFDGGKYRQYRIAEGIELIVAFDSSGVSDIRVETVIDGKLMLTHAEGVSGETIRYGIKEFGTPKRVVIGSSAQTVTKQYGKPASDWEVVGVRWMQYANQNGDAGISFGVIDQKVVCIAIGRSTTIWPE